MRNLFTCSFILLISLFGLTALYAQPFSGFTYSSGTEPFVQITGTQAPQPSSTDDGLYPAIPIGFSFEYLGTSYTTMTSCTNGWIHFGSTTLNSWTNNLSSGTLRPLLAPLWDDLDMAQGSFRYQTSVIGSDSVFIAQWLNVEWNFLNASPVISFQVHLNQTERSIKFVYRQESGSPSSASASIGINATATGAGNFVSLSNSSATPLFSTTTENTLISASPASNQFYKFTPVPPQPVNMGVLAIIDPLQRCGLGATEPIRIVLQNAGTTPQSNFSVGYSINGGLPVSEFFTGTVAPGDTVSYFFTSPGSFASTTTTTFNLSAWVSATGDSFGLNDTANATRVRYIAPLPIVGFTGYNGSNVESITSGWGEATTASHLPNNSSWINNTTTFPGNTSAAIALTTGVTGVHSFVSPAFETVGADVFEFLAARGTTAGGVATSPMGADDSVCVLISTDCGASWTTLFTFTNSNSPINVLSTYMVPLGLASGVKAQVAIAAYLGTVASTNSGNFFIDDLRVRVLSGTDMRTTLVLTPSRDCDATTAAAVTIRLNNAGANAQSFFPVSYSINGGPVVSETFTGTIASGANQDYTFTQAANVTNLATVEVKAWSSLPGDTDPTNDTATRTFSQFLPPYPPVTFTGFTGANLSAVFPGWVEGAGFPPTIGTGNWTSNTTAFSGNTVATISLNTSVASQNWIISHAIDATPNTALEFSAAWATTGGAVSASPIGADDSVVIGYSTDCGLTWTQVFAFNTANTPSNQLLTQIVPLALASNTKVRIGIAAITGTFSGGVNFFVDNLLIRELTGSNLQMFAITAPVSGCNLTSSTPVSVTIRNVGTAPQSNFLVGYRINGGTPIIELITATVNPGANLPYTFATGGNFIVNGAGLYSVDAWVSLPGDTDSGNDSLFGYSVLNIPNVSTFPYTEGFEMGAGGWLSGGDLSTWALGTPSGTVINSAGGGSNSWVTNLSGLYNANERSFVISPCFDFSLLTDPRIEMKVWWNMENNWDGSQLQSSIDGGATWQQVGVFQDPNGQNWYNSNTFSGSAASFFGGQTAWWSGRASSNNGSGGWVTVKNRLVGLAGQSSVRLRITFGADGSGQDNGFAFDDILIGDSPAADVGILNITSPGSGCGLSATNPVTVRIRNFGTTSQSNFQVGYVVDNGTPVTELYTGAIPPVSDTLFTFFSSANLGTPGTYTIRAWTDLASDANASNDTFQRIVTSIPTVSTFPYTEGFESGAGGWVSGGVLNSWALGAPSGSVINSAGGGSNSWVTNLSGNYNDNERSFVVSPCLDFSTLVNPQIEMKVWWNMENNWDGSQLQSSTDGGATWQQVGVFQDPNGQNWYNSNTFSGSAATFFGGQTAWWSGRASSNNGSGGWVIVRNRLTGLAGQSSVRLRVTFGSDGSGVDNGFAFDDILIADPAANDLQLSRVIAPFSGCGLTATTPVTVRIRNRGSVAQSNFQVSYQMNTSSFPVTELVTASISAGDSLDYTFITPIDFVTLGVGTYTMSAWVALTGDQNPLNDTLSGHTIVFIPTITPSPSYYEHFDSGNGGWISGGVANSWQLGAPSGSLINSAASAPNAWVTNLTGSHNDSEQSFIRSPCLNFSSLTNPHVSLSIWWDTETCCDGAVLQSSIDGGASWQRVGNLNDPNNWYNGSGISGNPGGQNIGWRGNGTSGSAGWVTASNALAGLAGQASVFLRIAFGSDGSVVRNGVAIDDFYIQDGIITGLVSVSNDVEEMQVYPVPVRDRLKVQVSATLAASIRQVVIINAQGKVLRTINSNELEQLLSEGLDVSALPEGIYFASFYLDKGIVTRKLIKQ